MIGLRTNQNPIPHDSHRCRTLTSPSPAMTWPTGAICFALEAGTSALARLGQLGIGQRQGADS